jgi:hypothetical protein
MKKILLLSFVFALNLSLSAQEFVTINKQKVDFNNTISHKQIIQEGDTSNYLELSFRNSAYTHITDTGLITFFSTEDAQSFLDAVDKALKYKSGGTLIVDFAGGKIVAGGKLLTVYNEKSQYFYANAKSFAKYTSFVEQNIGVLKTK